MMLVLKGSLSGIHNRSLNRKWPCSSSRHSDRLVFTFCHGEGSMVRLSHGPAKYSEETVDSKLKREEEREREALPLRLSIQEALGACAPKRKEAISSVDTRS